MAEIAEPKVKRKPKNFKGNNQRRNYTLDPIEKNNDKLFAYYKAQPVIPAEEFDAFVETIKIDLPASFRIQLSLPEKDLVDKYLHEHYFEKIAELHEDFAVPKPLRYVPYGYQSMMTRNVMRSHPLLRDFHQFLVSETEIGVISRQEAVSMVPPLLLDIKTEHFVLDMCAAPGSKTMQLIEMMHADNPNPTGMIVANDIDYSRCYLLVHQTLKRMPTANCIVVNQDASQIPTVVDENEKPVLFDRVLCDVICTGDGTFRKNPELWRQWDPQKALNLHKIQIHIAKRGLELLKVGGRMVYSTCSLNPIEDEAVVAYLLRKFDGKVKLVDVSKQLPDLKRSPGISSWTVFDKNMQDYPNAEAVPEAVRKSIVESMFPPTPEEAAKFNLDRAFRILPHHQNSGGFYVAVLEKTEAFNTDDRVWKPAFLGPPDRKRKRKMVREDPFNFLSEQESEDVATDMKEHYGIRSDFPFKNLLIRSAETEKKKVVYFANDFLRKFMTYNENRFKVVNAGVAVLRRVDKVSVSKFRLTQDGLAQMIPYISKRVVPVEIGDAIKILEGSNGNHFVTLEELENPGELQNLPSGGIVIKISNGDFQKDVCVWLGAKTVTAFISKEEKIHSLVMLGHNPVKLREQAQTTRQMKAQGQGGRIPKTNDAENKEDEDGHGNAEEPKDIKEEQ